MGALERQRPEQEHRPDAAVCRRPDEGAVGDGYIVLDVCANALCGSDFHCRTPRVRSLGNGCGHQLSVEGEGGFVVDESSCDRVVANGADRFDDPFDGALVRVLDVVDGRVEPRDELIELPRGANARG
ncbi:hypothetical protein RCF27_11225 [Rhodococcus pyridinivorans]|uniref:hypothetical protein n=1 Tax=Rhodococcus pyridinivorans TaxID=103816 RepID=UPI00280B4457|nr:hypothetical protein [Rhodococcus pyridinivorans]WMM74795.1 hypothetical protein RCF27_11225 [Rhodococcus pyridinivorans]